MATKKRTLRAIDLNGSPLNQFTGNEFEIWEDTDGKVHITLDKAKDISGATIDTWNTGKADLIDGKVPAEELPSYVDDVVNGYLHDGKFYEEDTYETEIDPEEGKIYVDLATNISYRWSGLAYTPIGLPVEANPTLEGDEPTLEGIKIGQQAYKIRPHVYDIDGAVEDAEDFDQWNIGDIIIEDIQNGTGGHFYTTYVVTAKDTYENGEYEDFASMKLTAFTGALHVKTVDFILDTGTGDISSYVAEFDLQPALLAFTNVAASTWVSDSTMTDYSYKCDLVCTGLTADSVVYVEFGDTEAASGNYCSTVETGTDKVTIWSKVNTSITIPLIKEI